MYCARSCNAVNLSLSHSLFLHAFASQPQLIPFLSRTNCSFVLRSHRIKFNIPWTQQTTIHPHRSGERKRSMLMHRRTINEMEISSRFSCTAQSRQRYNRLTCLSSLADDKFDLVIARSRFNAWHRVRCCWPGLIGHAFHLLWEITVGFDVNRSRAK